MCSLNLRGLTRWSAAPARDVATATTPRINMIRGLAARATTPLLPDDYLKMLNPLWTARELRGAVVDVRRETEDSATVTIKPGWGFKADYRPGQYVGIGLRVDGRWHWRSYSLTSVPERDNRLISITVKATPEGFLSTHLVDGVAPGTIVRLAAPKGDFALPDPPPDTMLFVTAGSGITPVMAMLRTLAHRGQTGRDIVHVHSAPSGDDVIFREELQRLHDRADGYRLHLQLTDRDGHLDFGRLEDIVADWRQRQTWACGPPAMLDTIERVWAEAGVPAEQLHMERFVIARTDRGGEGGTITFAVSDKTVEVDGATSLLEAGEQVGIQMPFGCRMGICQTCVLPLESGHVRDFRSGTEHGAGDRIQTCISAAAGNCTINV
ncbi:ferredoxin reductase [Mycolicibacterium diernhoferi]|uniref:Ferredoxin reductase n=1 Tax=Mycolicibacterium diernhoferi TaxID=1801 RepID=A0A1Q4HH77_9MYCO|nr:ferredoxin reductase [Mycolicibacterium diernhoferi]OJZ66853.1 stearoyl-CoA 9-desaturase [Mycolicibacterium diernhoferi]OPE53743.1 stearoyl-CoA 9-desaturase [Mycolicibacterium diernhoferi]PEG51502.1 ferredoxin reductase [Mycolicibacterium diernhoferi]QYL23044.1 ferredoxin reductase [Mycolicibacterium diernhoferi]